MGSVLEKKERTIVGLSRFAFGGYTRQEVRSS